MAGAASSETILFIGAVVAATLVAGSLNGLAGNLAEGMDQRADALGSQLRGRVAIVNDPLNVPTSPLTLYVKNTGTETLWLGGFVVLVDGQASGDVTYTVDGAATDSLEPGALATFSVHDVSPAAGDHRAVVVASNGHRASLDFVV